MARRNPFTLALAVLWGVLAVLALVLLVAGMVQQNRTFDEPGLPPHAAVAGILYAASGASLAVGVLVLAVHLGVLAVRWNLDPAFRAASGD